MIRSRIRRLERRSEGGLVRVRQRAGTTRTFLADDFWWQLFLSEAGAAVGEYSPSAASLAMEGATEEARAEVAAMIAGKGGTFLQAATVNGFGNVEPEILDLSEPS